MAICYECDEQFYGHACSKRGWEAAYNCWNCSAEIVPNESFHCKKCGWYVCDSCEECGCKIDSLLLKEEESHD